MISRLLVLMGVLAASLALPAITEAASIVVDALDAVPGRRTCTLASAAIAASENRVVGSCRAGDAGRTDVITFTPGLRGVSFLPPSVVFAGPMRVQGPGSDKLVLDGYALAVEPGAGNDFSIEHLTIRSGLLLRDARAVDIRSVRFSDIVSQMLGGGAIAAPSAHIETLRIHGSEFLRITSELGAISLDWGARVGSLEISHCRFESNEATGASSAGALQAGRDNGAITIESSDFIGNRAMRGFAGAVASGSFRPLSISRSTFHSNRGGEAGALHAPFAPIRIINSSLLQNSGLFAAAILDGFELDIRFSALVDNGDGLGSAPTLAGFNHAWRMLRGNTLRGAPGRPLCDRFDAEYEYNDLYGGYPCGMGLANRDHVGAWLIPVLAGPGRPAVPAPFPHAPGVDRVPYPECVDADFDSIAYDIRGEPRPRRVTGELDPYGQCDVGPVEVKPDDFTP